MDEFSALQKLPYPQVLLLRPESVRMERAKAGFLAGQRESFFSRHAAPADPDMEAGADWAEGAAGLEPGHSDEREAGRRGTPYVPRRPAPAPPLASFAASTRPKAFDKEKIKKMWKKTPPTTEEKFELGPLPPHGNFTPPLSRKGGDHVEETEKEGSEQVI